MWLPKLRVRSFNLQFPQVLVFTCFAGHIHENTSKCAKHESVFKQNARKATYLRILGGNTHEDEALTHPITAMTKTVQGGATQGVAAPPLPPYRPTFLMSVR
jgi:hypothetical protein